jgi:hypothetical protein
VLVDKNGQNPELSIVDLMQLKELKRVRIVGFLASEMLVDINFCNV